MSSAPAARWKGFVSKQCFGPSALIRILLALVMVWSACGNISLKDDVYGCTLGDPSSCPSGWFCRVSQTADEPRCFRTPAGEVDATVDADGDTAPDATNWLCQPGQSICNGNVVMVCRADLMGWEELRECDPNAGEICDEDEGACANLCDLAADQKSNVGCDYIATDMGSVDENSVNDSCYVVIVSNVQPEGTAVVTVEDDQGILLNFPGVGTQWHINPGELAVLPITGNAGECSLSPARPNATTMNTGLMPGSTFRVKSTLPVVAYQINPYEAASKHTTDAALLIPVPALGDQYIAATYEGLGGYPASISIVAVWDNTVVTIAPSVNIMPGGPVTGGATPFDVTLNAMEHLQLLASPDLDLINTVITSTARIAVYSGALCANVPASMGYCDHLEEMMVPVSSWGLEYVAAVPPQRASENAYWRIIAALDQTHIFVEPYSQYDRILNRGEVLEIDELGSFLVTATSGSPDPTQDPHPIMVVNYLRGREWLSRSPRGPIHPGSLCCSSSYSSSILPRRASGAGRLDTLHRPT